MKALDVFVAAYGDEASNLALKLMASGGVYLGGGIAPRIVDKLKGPAFMEAFTAKGRLGPLLATIPVRVIMNDDTALLGAARCAALRAALIQPPRALMAKPSASATASAGSRRASISRA